MPNEFGVYLKPSTFGKDIKPFLKDACSQIFGSATGLVDMMVAHIPSSKAGNATKVTLSFLLPALQQTKRVLSRNLSFHEKIKPINCTCLLLDLLAV